MHSAYWRKSFVDQPYLIIGSAVDSRAPINARTQPQYLLLPSGFPHHMDPKNIRVDDRKGYWRRENVRSSDAAKPTIKAREYPSLRVGSPFMKGNVDPLRFLVDFQHGSIYRPILELIRGDGPMYIDNPSSFEPNWPFDRGPYHTTVRKVHQAAWNYGGVSGSVSLTSLWLTIPF